MSRKRPLSDAEVRILLECDESDVESGAESDGLEELYSDAQLNVSSDDDTDEASQQQPTAEAQPQSSEAADDPEQAAATAGPGLPLHQVTDVASALSVTLDPDNYDPVQQPPDVRYVVQMRKPTRTDPGETITWSSRLEAPPGRQSRANVIKNRPGVRGQLAKSAKTPIQAWSLFFDDDMVDLLVDGTNKRLREKRSMLTEQARVDSRYNDTDRTEMKAFIGLAYARGLLGQNHHDVKRVFHPQTGHHIFSATMSLRRFQKINAHLCMDDPATRAERWTADRFAACRELFEKFKNNCLKHVVAEEMVSLDETLYPTRNLVKFRQYNRSKPAKYGLLFRSVNATTYPFTYTTIVYAGRPVGEPGPHYVTGLEDAVKTLLTDMKTKNSITGRNVTMDRLYTSVPLARWMLEEHVTVVGTLNITRRGIPPAVKSLTGREDNSYVALFEPETKLSLHSYAVTTKSSGKRNVLLLTTMNPIMGVTRDERKKPAIYRLYDVTKGGTDVVDQRMRAFTTKTKSRKWTVVTLCYILDTCRVNAGTVMALNTKVHPRELVSVNFGWDLALQLVEPHVRRRSTEKLPRPVKARISLLLDEDEDGAGPSTSGAAGSTTSSMRRRCATCVRSLPTYGYTAGKNKLKKVTTVCCRCGEPLCAAHCAMYCERCRE